jgi:hypothetical protein
MENAKLYTYEENPELYKAIRYFFPPKLGIEKKFRTGKASAGSAAAITRPGRTPAIGSKTLKQKTMN